MQKRIALITIAIALLLVSGIVMCEMMRVEQYVIEVTPDAEITQELRNVQE